MVTIKKKLVGTREYYYLQHTIRTKNGVKTKERYLGTQIPKNIEKIKLDFLTQIYKERWYPILDRIRANYLEEHRKMPKSLIEKQIHLFSVKFTYDTNRIEGSKLTYRETADLLERGLTPKAKSLDDIKEAEAHEKVFYEMLNCGKELSLQLVLSWHKKMFAETKPDIAGRIREHQVAISGSKFMPPSPAEVRPLLQEFFRWYNRNKKKLHPVELAASVHLKFVTIHPFADGNGRIGRLLMNFVLQKHGFPLLNIPYENRGSYYNALERSQIKKNNSIFIHWLFRRYVKEHKAYASEKR
ncbi:MAG: Fic family protein [Candidatus Micrarchaeia archaeon]